jgi:hypothetical protein
MDSLLLSVNCSISGSRLQYELFNATAAAAWTAAGHRQFLYHVRTMWQIDIPRVMLHIR